MPLAVFSRRLSWILILLLGLTSSGCTLLSAGAVEATETVSRTSPAAVQPTGAAANHPPAAMATPTHRAQSSTPQPSATIFVLDNPASTPTRVSPVRTPTPASTLTAPSLDTTPPALLALNFDVVFLRQGSLYRWSHTGKQLEVIFGPSAPGLIGYFKAETPVYPGIVVEFAADGQQRRLVALVDRGISANGVSLYDLLLVDLERGTARTLLAETRRLSWISLSPDGTQLAYLDTINQQIYRLSIQGTEPPQVIAGCQPVGDGDCVPVWSLSGRYLAWSGGQELWRAESPAWQPVLASSLMLTLVDIAGGSREVRVTAAALVWAPFDRYLLAEVSPAGGAPRRLALLDMRTGAGEVVPGASLSSQENIPAVWLADGRLVTIRLEAGEAQVDIWQVFPTRQPMLSRQSSLEISLEAAGFTDLQAVANRFLLLRGRDEANLSGMLARLDLDFGEINWTLALPGGVYRAAWAPDGSGAFLQAAPDIGLYAPAGSSEYYDLRHWFGEELSRLTWCLATGKSDSGDIE